LEAVRAACPAPEQHHVLPLDVAATETHEAAAAEVERRVGPVDLLVHSAGISQRGTAAETGLHVDRRIMEVNYFGAVSLTKAVLPTMLAAGRGHIAVISSVVGVFGTPQRSAYAASKHALHGFFDSLRAEVYDAGLRVTLVCPGYVRTEITRHALTADGTPYDRMDAAQEHGMAPALCAQHILTALEEEKNEVYIGGREVLGVYLKRFLPSLFHRFIRRIPTT
jgi:short-subunit dehydrogenase